MTYCCVPFCKSNATKPTNPRTSFHEFPCDEHLRQQWLRRIARKDFVINDKSGSSVVCSKHFTQHDYRPFLKIPRLKIGAIPTVFPMYPSYALLPPPNNYLSLVSLNDVKKPSISIVKDKIKNSRKKALIDVSVKSDMNSTNNNLVEQQHDDRVLTNKNLKKDTLEANNSHSLVSSNNAKNTTMVETVSKNSTKIAPGDIVFNSDITSTNNSQEKDIPDANNKCIRVSLNHVKSSSNVKEGTPNSTRKGCIEIDVDSDKTSINNSSVAQQHKDRVFTLNKSMKNPPAANNGHSLASLNSVKKLSIMETVTENLIKIAPVDIAFNFDITSTNKNLEYQQQKHGIFTNKKAKKDTIEANNSSSLNSLNLVNMWSMVKDETQNSTKKSSLDIAVNSDMTSTNNNSREQLHENHSFMKGTQNSTIKCSIEIDVNSDMTSTNNNLVEQQLDRVLTIKKSMKDSLSGNGSRSLVSINHVKRASMAETVTENLIKKLSAGIAFNSEIASTNEKLEFQQQKRRIHANKMAKKDTLAANNSCSLVSLNHVIKRSMVEDETQNSTQKSSIDIAVNSELASTNNNLVKLQHKDHVFTIKKATEDPSAANNNQSPIILIYVKKPSTAGTVTENPTKIVPADVPFDSVITSTNNNLVKYQHEDRVFTIKKAKKDTQAANNRSYITLKHVKKQTLVETITENSTKIVPVDTALNSVMTSTKNNLREQQHEDLACTIKNAKDPNAANINRSYVGLNPAKRPSTVETVTENSTKIVPVDDTIKSDTTSTKNNLREQQHVDNACMIKKAKKNPAAANMNHSCVSLTHVKSPSMVTSTNNSIKFVLQTKVTDQQKEIKRLRGLLRTRDRTLKKMKEEMEKLKSRVSFYEYNSRYEILRKALTTKENCPQ